MNLDVKHRMEQMQKRAADYKSFSSQDEATVKVLFASESGTAEGLAREFADACQLSYGADAMADANVEEIDGTTTIFFVSTAGQGSMPRNGTTFLKQLNARKESFAESTSFSIMGLGDSSYYFFLKAAKDLENAMLKLGAKCIYPLGEGDDSCAEEGLAEGLHKWQQGIFPALGLEMPEEVPHIMPVDLLFSKRVVLSEFENNHSIQKYYASIGTKEVRISYVEHLSEEGHNRDFISFTLQTGSKELTYELGDSLEIFPKNDEADVSNFLHEYSMDWDERTVIKLSHAFGMHGEISIGTIFTNVLDIFGKPNISFLQKLATFEADAGKRKVMLDPANLRQLCLDRCVTYADLLLLYNSARPPLAALLTMIPTIKGRAYSITTAPSASPDSVELCVLINIYWCKGDGSMRYGTASNMLRKLKVGDTVFCRVKPGMEPPKHDQSGK